jgi:hypothetical protein
MLADARRSKPGRFARQALLRAVRINAQDMRIVGSNKDNVSNCYANECSNSLFAVAVHPSSEDRRQIERPPTIASALPRPSATRLRTD